MTLAILDARELEYVLVAAGAEIISTQVAQAEAAADRAEAAAEEVMSFFEIVESNNLYNPATMRVPDFLVGSNSLIQPSAGWAYIKIPVTPGQAYAWASNTTRRVGSNFMDAAGVGIAGTYSNAAGTGGVSQTRTAPAGAAFLGINVLSPTIPEPTQMMVNLGTVALPYEAWFEPYYVLSPESGEAVIAEAVEQAGENVDDTINVPWIDVLDYGDFVGGNPIIRSGSPIVDLAQPDLLVRGVNRGIQWRAGNDFVRYIHGSTLLGKYYFGWFVPTSADVSNLVTGAKIFEETDGGVTSVTANVVEGYEALTSETRLVWGTGLVDTDVQRLVIGSSTTPPIAGTLFASDFGLFLSDAPIDKDEAIRQANLSAKARAEAMNWAQAVTPLGPVIPRSTLVLTGLNSVGYVESDRSGHTIRNTFLPFPTVGLTTVPCRFDLRDQYLNGVAIRSGSTDDITPDHVEGTTLGGNHGYLLGRCTINPAHSLTVADEGDIVTRSGVQYVLVKVESPTSLLLATRLANTAPPTGTFTHSSGTFFVSAVAAVQWYPPHNNYNMRVFVDGGDIESIDGTFAYENNVQFVETCDILSRQTIIDWWIANGGASGGLVVSGSPLYRLVTTYRFDLDGQLTVHRDWIFLANTNVADLMGLQVQRLNAPTNYRLPGSEPFTYDGSSVDYGNGVASDRTLTAAGTPSINFNATNLQATGEYAHRVLSEWSSYAFAVGMLPVGAAAYDVRRTNTSARALELRGNSAKLYFRIVDKGDYVAAAGESVSMVGFRHVVPRSSGQPMVTTVRMSPSRAFVYIDGVNFAGFDSVSIPPDLTGWDLTVADSRNASLIGTGPATGDLTFSATATGDHYYLVLDMGA